MKLQIQKNVNTSEAANSEVSDSSTFKKSAESINSISCTIDSITSNDTHKSTLKQTVDTADSINAHIVLTEMPHCISEESISCVVNSEIPATVNNDISKCDDIKNIDEIILMRSENIKGRPKGVKLAVIGNPLKRNSISETCNLSKKKK